VARGGDVEGGAPLVAVDCLAADLLMGEDAGAGLLGAALTEDLGRGCDADDVVVSWKSERERGIELY